MATATQKQSPAPPSSRKPASPRPDPLAAALLAVYRFLASLKLAVISLLSLATLLGIATWVESRYGAKAAAQLIYHSPAFAVVLAFLGTNILCAALIRYPWTKRQTGFVITHAGLLVVLAGSLITYLKADEGNLGLVEGEGKDQEATLIRDNTPILKVRTPAGSRGDAMEYAFPFRPGVWAWGPGHFQMLSGSDHPFKLAIKGYLPSSMGHYEHEPVNDGVPMIKVGVSVQPPGALRPVDPFEDDLLDRRPWLVADNRLRRSVSNLGPAKFAFQYVDSPEMVEDFLSPPKDPTHQKLARLHYHDRQGKPRVYEWPIDDADPKEKEGDKPKGGKSVSLPDSDLTATFVEAATFPDPRGDLSDRTGWDAGLPVVQFRVRKGDGPEVDHYGWASLPMMPSRIPGHGAAGEKDAEALLRVDYFHPPMGGRFGLVEILGTDAGTLYYRVFGRDGLRGKGPLRVNETVRAFGGGPNQPMSLTFRVKEFFRSGRERFTMVPHDLPVGELDKAIPACLAELTVDGETREIWLQRLGQFKPQFSPVKFPRGEYELSFDMDRKPLGFKIELKDFHVGVDPGTQTPSSFESKVLLTDEEQGIKDKAVTISMNEPMTHRHYTFYQSSYNPLTDEDGRPTGQFMSIFQVGYDPGRIVKYAGCLLVVLGTFVQFYMRAGVFTDGGKAERARAAAREARRQAKAAGGNGSAAAAPESEDESGPESL